MEIKVIRQPNKKYIAILDIDGADSMTSAPFDRPGCAVRYVLNRLSVIWGLPDSDISLTVDGW